MKKKAKYPNKTSINLAMTEVASGSNKMSLIYFGIFLVVLIVFVRFAVINPVMKVWEKESAYDDMQSQIDQMNEKLKDYEKVSQEYSHYSDEYKNPEELMITDRNDALNLVDTCVLKQADVQSIEISGGTMTLVLSDTRLSTVSAVVSDLQDDERTRYVTVSTAAPQNTKDRSQLVSATIIVELGSEADPLDAAQDTTRSGGDAS